MNIVERLRATEFDPNSARAPYQRLVNPDGPEAASLINEAIEALEREMGRRKREYESTPEAQAFFQRNHADTLATLAKLKSETPNNPSEPTDAAGG